MVSRELEGAKLSKSKSSLIYLFFKTEWMYFLEEGLKSSALAKFLLLS